jgi:nucleotide-binding universal stress UspA family protein
MSTAARFAVEKLVRRWPAVKPTILRWSPILVGVDHSPESAGAVLVASRLARLAGTTYHPVHAVQDPGTAFAAMVLNQTLDTPEHAVERLARPALRDALRSHLPPPLLDAIEIRLGRPIPALQSEATRLDSRLVILGGKRHSVPERWLAGGTAREAVRTLGLPVLVTKGAPQTFRRVLVALDLSYATEPTIGQAERFASLVGGQLRAVHVLEPVSVLPTPKPRSPTRSPDASPVDVLERHLWPVVRSPDAERTVRTGEPATVLTEEAAAWEADLLVVGSHRKRWLDRLLLGTVTERLLDDLPVSLLVVPVRPPSVGESRSHAPAQADAQPGG